MPNHFTYPATYWSLLCLLSISILACQPQNNQQAPPPEAPAKVIIGYVPGFRGSY